jgi:hypothetical protein
MTDCPACDAGIPKRYKQLVVVEGGYVLADVEYEPIVPSEIDKTFEALRKSQIEEICKAFAVDLSSKQENTDV